MPDFRLSFSTPDLNYTKILECTNIITGAPDEAAAHEMFSTIMNGPGTELTELAPAGPEDNYPSVSYLSYARLYHR